MLDASTPVSDASSLPITSGVTTLTRLLGPRWPVAVGHTLMAFSWAGESRTRITGRPWREGTPRHRGGPGGKEASRHASSGPEMARLGASAAPHHRRGRGRHGDRPGRASFRTRRGVEIAVGSDRGFARLRGGLLPWR